MRESVFAKSGYFAENAVNPLAKAPRRKEADNKIQIAFVLISDGMLQDEELVQAYRDGNSSAFDALFERHRSRVFQFVLRMMGNRAEAEEVFQDIFLRVHRKLYRYESQERFGAWLFAVANRMCLDALRKRKRERWLSFGDKIADPVASNDPERELYENQIKVKMMREVEKLETNVKQVFLLRIEGNLMFREIAEVLDIPLNTALARYHQAVSRLKESMKTEMA